MVGTVVNRSCARLFRPVKVEVFGLLLMSWPGAAFCGAATADFAPRLGWNASTNSQVTGYKLLLRHGWPGRSRMPFSRAITRTDVVPGLAADTTYFFAATSVDSVGDESPFSNVTAFEGEYASAGAPLECGNDPGGLFHRSADV
jgi:hypothetical protein